MTETIRRAALVCAAVLMCAVLVSADPAKGTASYSAKSGPITVKFTHAFLMKGPDIVGGKPIRRLVLTTKDVSAALKACENMMCSDGGIVEGMTVDFDAGPRLHYWFVANNQRVQYSGTADPTEATLKTDSPTRIAGTLKWDDTAGQGPKVDVEFDATLVKELKK